MAAPASAAAAHDPPALDCGVCLQPFHYSDKDRRPRTLACGHSFCESDLEVLLKDNMITSVHMKLAAVQ